MKPLIKSIQTAAVFAGILFSGVTAMAQTSLDDYISQGLKANESIRQQDFELEKNLYALKEAKSMFLPDVTFGASYSKTHGGRTIDVPLGDLLNNVYTSLNKLTGSNSFPQLANEHILINPDNFYDTHFRTTFPILNAELIYNKRIKGQQVELQQQEVQLYKRELVKDIKTAYYQYLKADKAVEIYNSSLMLVREGLRVNNALLKNSKVNRTSVLRSENEVSRISASLNTAVQTRQSAKNYFNFLLNRGLTDSVKVDPLDSLPPVQEYGATTVENREELAKLKLASGISGNLTSLQKSYLVPKVNTYVDLGSQSFDWKFNDNSRYYFWGISLEWNLFSFGRHSNRIKQAVAEQKGIAAQTDYVWLQLQTDLEVRQHDLISSVGQYEAAITQLHTAKTYYGDEFKLYKEGLAIYIELLDAQNQLIDARLQANITLYDTWIAKAAIERATAGFQLQ